MTPPAPSISVIIPYRNQPDSLLHCLQSIHTQAFDLRRVEVIVVDNGSNSLPIEICSAFEGVRLEREGAPGPGPARNKGATESRGAILAFFDADCVADCNWLAEMDRAFSDDSLQIAGGDMLVAFADPQQPTKLEAYESVFSFRQQEFIEQYGFSATANLAVRRAAYFAVGPFAGIDIAEDREWGRRAARVGFATRFVPGMIVYHSARQSLSELFGKWDRHIRHDFAELAPGPVGRLAWIIRALAIACSPIVATGRIFKSKLLATWRDRFLAAEVLFLLRFYRACRMLALLLGRPYPKLDQAWNR